MPPALAAGLASTCGFVFPVSTPPNAIVFGTGRVPLTRMIRAGALLDVACVLVVWTGCCSSGPGSRARAEAEDQPRTARHLDRGDYRPPLSRSDSSKARSAASEGRTGHRRSDEGVDVGDDHRFAFDASHASTVSLCVERRLMVSARSKPLRSIDRLRESVRQGETFRSTAELLAHLLRDQADVMVQIVRDATGRVNSVEDSLLANRVGSSRAKLGALRRVLVRLQRLLAPEPAALFRLLSRPPAWLGEQDQQDLRQAAEEFATAVADSAALGERVKILQEELAAVINERTNRTLFVLTVVTVLALPFNVIGGLFGMNVGGIPFAESTAGFWVVVGLVAAFTAVAGLWALGKRPQ